MPGNDSHVSVQTQLQTYQPLGYSPALRMLRSCLIRWSWENLGYITLGLGLLCISRAHPILSRVLWHVFRQTDALKRNHEFLMYLQIRGCSLSLNNIS